LTPARNYIPMFDPQENIPLKPKTTLKIGGKARWYAELQTKEDCEEAHAFAKEKGCPLIVLGGGSNTIFADGTIEAMVVRIKSKESKPLTIESFFEKDPHKHIWTSNIGPAPIGGVYKVNVTAGKKLGEEGSEGTQAGKNLAGLINELAELNLDLSPLTGIPGTIGGAVYGNSGQGFGGKWIGSYIYSVEALVNGEWKLFGNEDCEFGYRTSVFKKLNSPIIWAAQLHVPSRESHEIKADIESLLQKRIETQPHVKTAGSCFLSIDKETPAWKLIDEAGLRGEKVGGIRISEKHANFLINEGEATFEDAKAAVKKVEDAVEKPLQVEMRFVQEDGSTTF